MTSDLEAAPNGFGFDCGKVVSVIKARKMSQMSQSGGGVATYLVWTAVSSVVERATGRLTAATLSEKRMFVSLRDCLWCLSIY